MKPLTPPLIPSPGYEVVSVDGHRRWLAEAGVVIEELEDHFAVQVPDLHDPVLIPADEVRRAAAGVSNLIAARIFDARRSQPSTVVDDPIDEHLATMLAAALLGRAR